MHITRSQEPRRGQQIENRSALSLYTYNAFLGNHDLGVQRPLEDARDAACAPPNPRPRTAGTTGGCLLGTHVLPQATRMGRRPSTGVERDGCD